MNKLTTAMTALLLTAVMAVSQIPTNGLVCFFPFINNYKDDCGNIMLDTSKPAAPSLTADRNGTANSAYRLMERNPFFKAIETSKLPSGNSDMTFSAWVYDSSTQFVHVITSWGTDTSKQYKEVVLYITWKNNKPNLGITNGADSAIAEIKPAAVSLTWMHVAFTIKAGSYTLFVNGKPITSNTMNFNVQTGGVFGLCTDMTNTNVGLNNFGGYVDDVCIYNRALSNEEIAYVYTCKSTKNAAPAITSTAATVAEALNIYTYNVVTSDADNQTVTLSLVVKPNGMTISGNKISWTPTNENTGKNTVAIVAKDVLGDSSVQTFEINVEPTTSVIKHLMPVTAKQQHVNIFFLPNGRICQKNLTRGLVVGQQTKRIVIR